MIFGLNSIPYFLNSVNKLQRHSNIMAWRCSGRSNLELVTNLRNSGIITSSHVFNALNSIDRKNYVDSQPYADSPQPLVRGQTISAPHMHAHALSLLEDEAMRENSNILDVGVGSGYLLSAFGRLNPTATCTGIDVYPELVSLARTNVMKEDADLMDRLEIPDACNGWQGYVKNAPYDAIHVGAAAEELPSDLLQQLKVGGKMVIPVGPQGGHQELLQVVRKTDTSSAEINANGAAEPMPIYNRQQLYDQFEITNLMGVMYVPLVR